MSTSSSPYLPAKSPAEARRRAARERDLAAAVGRNLRSARVARKLSEEAGAEAVGESVEGLRVIEAGGEDPARIDLVVLARIACGVGVDPAELLKER